MDPVKFLEELINIPSLSGEEEEVSRRLEKELKSLRFDEVSRLGNNVCGIRGSGPVKLLYDAHTDVVDPGTGWAADPFRARNDGVRITGRGACDDKGTLVSMVYGAAAADVEGITLYMLGSVREEISEGNGIREFFSKSGIRPDFSVIGEPSELKVSLGNRGRVALRIKLAGKAGHASNPSGGINAIYRAAEVIDGVRDLNESRLSSIGDSVTVTKISTPERGINIIPEVCSIWLDYRSAPGRELEEIKEFFGFIGDSDSLEVISPYYRPWEIPGGHPFVKAAEESAAESGCSSEKTFWNFCTNASYTAGELNIPTIGFGPGSEEECHTAEESIIIEQVRRAVGFYRALPGKVRVYAK